MGIRVGFIIKFIQYILSNIFFVLICFLVVISSGSISISQVIDQDTLTEKTIITSEDSDEFNYWYFLDNIISWEYSVLVKFSSADEEQGKMYLNADGQETIRGVVYNKYIAEYDNVPGAVTRILYYRQTDEGLFGLEEKYKDLADYIVVPFPLEIGSTWIVIDPDKIIEYELDSKETLEVAGRIYENCFKLNLYGNYGDYKFNGYEYISFDIGTIKNRTEYENGIIEYWLISYESK